MIIDDMKRRKEDLIWREDKVDDSYSEIKEK
jgi:hypothetical protein